MKSVLYKLMLFLIPVFILFISMLTGCKKENPIKFPKGIFPDSVYALSGINSEYDDYNMNIPTIDGILPVIFSSNRATQGGKFDLVQGRISFSFVQTDGNFILNSEMTNDIYYGTIISKANSSGNDFGPYSYFSSNDGFEYLILSSETNENGLDFFYLKNLPRFGGSVPSVYGPYPLTLINTSQNEAYIAFDFNSDSIYFCSDREGVFNIYVQGKNPGITTDLFFNRPFEPAVKVDSINSSYNDKTPFIYMNIMVFTSDRPGGLGGFDIYYSVFSNGKWRTPVNPGPPVNSPANEYRPVIITQGDFTNQALLFSSDRAGGKGGYDLYFTGYSFPVKRINY